MNGHQIAEENYQKFLSWMNNKTNEDFKQRVYRGQLSRKEIAAECGFGKSAINQNPRIKHALLVLEDNLRKQKILPEKIAKKADERPPDRDIEKTTNKRNNARLSRLEQENIALRAEIQHYKEILKRYQLLEEVMTESGRMPR